MAQRDKRAHMPHISASRERMRKALSDDPANNQCVEGSDKRAKDRRKLRPVELSEPAAAQLPPSPPAAELRRGTGIIILLYDIGEFLSFNS